MVRCCSRSFIRCCQMFTVGIGAALNSFSADTEGTETFSQSSSLSFDFFSTVVWIVFSREVKSGVSSEFEACPFGKCASNSSFDESWVGVTLDASTVDGLSA